MSTWSDVEWTSVVDNVPETKLDTMQGNLDYLRESSDYRVLATGESVTVGEEFIVGGQSPGTSEIRITCAAIGIVLGPVTLNAPSSGLVAATHANLAIPSGVAVGALHEHLLQLEWRFDSGSPWVTLGTVGFLYWVRDTDMAYLDVRCHIEAAATSRLDGTADPAYLTARFAGFALIGKRTTTS